MLLQSQFGSGVPVPAFCQTRPRLRVHRPTHEHMPITSEKEKETAVGSADLKQVTNDVRTCRITDDRQVTTITSDCPTAAWPPTHCAQGHTGESPDCRSRSDSPSHCWNRGPGTKCVTGSVINARSYVLSVDVTLLRAILFFPLPAACKPAAALLTQSISNFPPDNAV